MNKEIEKKFVTQLLSILLTIIENQNVYSKELADDFQILLNIAKEVTKNK
jgi:hypothetical protein